MNNKKRPSVIEVYLPSYSLQRLNAEFDFERSFVNASFTMKISKHKGLLNGLFCQSIGYEGVDLPWNQLRALQFNLEKNLQETEKEKYTLACCDPVMMQVTHRGAYLWGQERINFSTEDVIAIIAQINDKLMGDGEYFYLLNNKQWLYVNQKYIELKQTSFEDQIGRDQFGFSYDGTEGLYWDRLATEIQMLIKQMIDYNGLKGVPTDSLVNVHFWGDSSKQLNSPINTASGSELTLFSNDEMIVSLSEMTNNKHAKLPNIAELMGSESKRNVAIDFSDSSAWLTNMIKELPAIKIVKTKFKIILQDQVIELASKRSFFQRLFND